ncbi:hypothetical protein C817_01342 [Dorea sp. 5-2]|nr:hypothetical protein C817_01342 [Dorea sp. 5-2]
MKNISIMYEGTNCPFLIALHKKQNYIYGVNVYNNEVFYLDLTDRELHYCGRLPVLSAWKEKPVHNILIYQDFCFLIPFWNNTNLFIYDCKRSLWKKVPLIILHEIERSVRGEKIPGYYYGACMYHDQLFMLPFGCRHLIKYNILTGEVSDCADFGNTLIKEDIVLFHKHEWINTTCIALSCLYSNHIVLFNLETNEMDIKTVGCDDYRFSTIIKYGEIFWIVVKNKLIFLQWNPDTGYVKEFKAFPRGCMIVNDRHCFDESNIYLYSDALYCFPAACNMAVKFDLKQEIAVEIQSLTYYCQDLRLDREQSTFDGGVRDGEKVYLHYQLDKILEFDLRTESVQEYDRILRSAVSRKKRWIDEFAHLLESIPLKSNDKLDKKVTGEEIYDTVSKFVL